MNGPLVSVNIPAHNEERFIGRAILSVINQTYKNIEVIVLDDGSTDKTAEVVKELQKKDPRIRYYYQENKGLASARNRLFDLSQGEYIAFLDHDDEWLPEKLELQLPLFRDRPNAGLVFANMTSVYENGRQADDIKKRLPRGGKVFYDYLLFVNFLASSSVTIRRDVLKKYLPFNPLLTVALDWELFLRLARDYEFEYLDKVVGFYHVRKDSFTRKNPLREIEETLLVLDYWAKNDPAILLNYKRRFLRAKSKSNFHKYNFFKANQNYKDALRELLRCIYIDPTWLSLYLRLIKLLFLLIKKEIVEVFT